MSTYCIMSRNSNEGSRMIREIQEQQRLERIRREENAEGNRMIREIQAQQKLAREAAQNPKSTKKGKKSRKLLKKGVNKNEVFRRILSIQERQSRKKNSSNRSNYNRKTKRTFTL